MSEEIPKFEFLSENKTNELLRVFKGERTGFVFVGPQKYFFPHKITKHLSCFYNFKARSDDTWVFSYPRSGTTLTQELVWLLSNNLDFATAEKKLLSERFPFFEFSLFNHPEVTLEFLELNKGDPMKEQLCRDIAKPGYEQCDAISSPRFIKTHFPFSMLPRVLDTDGCKVVYVARNPKDVAVSWFNLNRAIKTQGYVGDFSKFWDYFEEDLTPWSPYWTHLKEAWNLRAHPNLLFIFYEEILHDFPKAIKNVAKFLGKTYTDGEIDKVADYLNIKNFRKNLMVNASELRACGIIQDESFVRMGGIGGWRKENIFTRELNEKANKWIKKNLSDTDLRFPFFDNNMDSSIEESNT